MRLTRSFKSTSATSTPTDFKHRGCRDDHSLFGEKKDAAISKHLKKLVWLPGKPEREVPRRFLEELAFKYQGSYEILKVPCFHTPYSRSLFFRIARHRLSAAPRSPRRSEAPDGHDGPDTGCKRILPFFQGDLRHTATPNQDFEGFFEPPIWSSTEAVGIIVQSNQPTYTFCYEQTARLAKDLDRLVVSGDIYQPVVCDALPLSSVTRLRHAW
ncbi:hypothetical protein HDK77DRAFT_487845 [Phyllosticta capitalensis]|uniref:Uncharacterized protein n=1 Tax=Phyllosticta capitalensis TaxID=121624 RepID=A0ABR1Y9Y4_9PEZI